MLGDSTDWITYLLSIVATVVIYAVEFIVRERSDRKDFGIIGINFGWVETEIIIVTNIIIDIIVTVDFAVITTITTARIHWDLKFLEN